MSETDYFHRNYGWITADGDGDGLADNVNILSTHSMVELSPNPITNTGTISLNYITSDGTNMDVVSGVAGTGILNTPSIAVNKTLLTDKTAGTNIKFLVTDDTNNTVGYATIPTQLVHNVIFDSLKWYHNAFDAPGYVNIPFIAERIGRTVCLYCYGHDTILINITDTSIFTIDFANPSIPALVDNFAPVNDFIATTDSVIFKTPGNDTWHLLFQMWNNLGTFQADARYLSDKGYNVGLTVGDTIIIRPFSVSYITP